MLRTVNLLTVIFTVFVTFSSFLISQPAQAAPSSLEQRQQLEALKSRVNSLRKSLATAENIKSKERAALRKLEITVGKQIRKLKLIERNIKTQERKLIALTQQQKNLQQSLQDNKKGLAGQLQAAYMMGRQEYMKMLMNQETPAVFGRTMRYYDYFNHARTDKMTTISETLRTLNEVEAKLIEENRTLLALRKSQKLANSVLFKDKSARKKVLASLERDINSKKRTLQNALGDIARLEELLLGLQRAIDDVAIAPKQDVRFSKLRGKLTLPVSGKLLARYGSRRKQGKLRWQGVMIDAKQGQAVRAISHGRVAFADWLRGFGLLIIIDHGEGYMSLYGHNQSLNMETGDWVESGEVIASAGNTGGRGRSGLYFEIRRNGKPTNPLRWCKLVR